MRFLSSVISLIVLPTLPSPSSAVLLKVPISSAQLQWREIEHDDVTKESRAHSPQALSTFLERFVFLIHGHSGIGVSKIIWLREKKRSKAIWPNIGNKPLSHSCAVAKNGKFWRTIKLGGRQNGRLLREYETKLWKLLLWPAVLMPSDPSDSRLCLNRTNGKDRRVRLRTSCQSRVVL